MKVAHLTSVHPRYDTRIFVKMCKSVAKAGHDTHLVVADGKGNENIDDVTIHDVGLWNGKRVSRIVKGVLPVYKKAKSLNADLYHFHDPELMPIGILLKLQGHKVIYDVHEDLPRQILRKSWIPKYLRSILSGVAKTAEYITAKIVDSVVTVTPTIAARFDYTKVIEVRNYASIEEFQDTHVAPNEKSNVTYIGAISKDRGVIPMVEAFAHSQSKFTLAGKFNEHGLEDRVSNLDGWQNTEFLGWQSREQVQQLLEKTLVGLVVLQPTGDYEDAFPVKLFEYMASGAAVVASDFPLWREIVDGAQCGICVDPTDPKAIQRAVHELVSDKNHAIELGVKGRAAVLEKYNWQTEAEKLCQLYQDIHQGK